MDRRHFLETLAVGLITAGCMPLRQAMPVRMSVPVERDEEELTPLTRFFVTAITPFAPKIDVAEEQLIIEGAVDHPFSMKYDELALPPQQTYRSVLQCVGGARGNAE